MPVVVVGSIEIPYEVREGPRTKRRHIVVTPGKVEVVVPPGGGGDIEAFVQVRRRWVFEKWTEVQAAADRRESIGTGRLVSGAKILYRGRRLGLKVVPAEGPARVEYRNGFILHRAPDTSDEDLHVLLDTWLKERVRDDIRLFVNKFSRKFGVSPVAIRVLDLKHIWGSCGEGGVIHLNWRLVHAPKPVLEYAVVHELCHLRHRTHGAEFWGLVESLLPDFVERKAWLTKNEWMLGVAAR